MHRLQLNLPQPLRRLVQHQQTLSRTVGSLTRDRGHQTTTYRQLVNPLLRHCLASSGRNNARIRSAFDIPQHAIAKQQV